MVKTVLFQRKQPLHLHFLADAHAENTLRHLMTSWELPQGITKCSSFFYYTMLMYNSLLIANIQE